MKQKLNYKQLHSFADLIQRLAVQRANSYNSNLKCLARNQLLQMNPSFHAQQTIALDCYVKIRIF